MGVLRAYNQGLARETSGYRGRVRSEAGVQEQSMLSTTSGGQGRLADRHHSRLGSPLPLTEPHTYMYCKSTPTNQLLLPRELSQLCRRSLINNIWQS